MLQHLSIHFRLIICQVAYAERWSITRGSKYGDLAWKLGILPRRRGRLRQVVATGGSTVFRKSVW